VLTVEDDWLGGIAERLAGRTGFEDEHLSVRTLGTLEEKLPEGVELVAAGGDSERLRRVKDAAELRAIGAAAELADEAWRWAIERGLGGRTERDVARATEARIRELGGDPSFPAIVAAGPNGALPHAEPGEREIGEGDLVVFDMGAQLDGYCSDGTRTFAVGEPVESAREVYEVVLDAQLAALDAVRAGIGGEPLDAVAREAIEAAGHGDRFGHGLGHGVGLEVHEAPRLSKRSEDVLEAGEVVTIEPGVYLPGELGVRIEDLVVITEDGHENLSGLPKELQVVE
jgi:Xaa-Pro aminopeptidase